MKKSRKLSRRNFLQTSGAGAAYLLGRPAIIKARPSAANSNVYVVHDESLMSGTTVDEANVKTAVDCCIMALTGQSSIDLAWQAAFPGITTSKTIAIKISCLNGIIHPHWATVKAFIDGLKSMFGGTFPASNIWLFDNDLWNSGKVNTAYGSSNLNALGIWHGEDSYGSPSFSCAGSTVYMSQRLNSADYGVSFCALRPHQYYAGFLSGVIKNMMGAASSSSGGSYGKPSGSFHSGSNGFRDLFQNHCYNKLNLYFEDMLFGTRHENYNSWTTIVKSIAMATDPCAMDSYVVDVINDPTHSPRMDNYNTTKQTPQALANAGMGSINYTKIDVPLSTVPQPASIGDTQEEIKGHKSGSSNQSQVQGVIDKYMKEEPK